MVNRHGFMIFDIETRIEKALVREALFSGSGLSDEVAFERYRGRLIAEKGNDFPSIPFHFPVSIAVGMVRPDHSLASVESIFGGCSDDPETLVRRFWKRADGYKGCFVTFNGRGFDFPVLELQALRLGISAPGYFGQKYGPRSRYSIDAHLDLLDFLTNYGAVRLAGGLTALEIMCGGLGKGTMGGEKVQDLWDDGRAGEIERYCREDVRRTFRLFLHVQVVRGIITSERAATLWTAAASMDLEAPTPIEGPSE